MIRVTKDRIVKANTLNHYLQISEWDEKSGLANDGYKQKKRLNNLIMKCISRVNDENDRANAVGKYLGSAELIKFVDVVLNNKPDDLGSKAPLFFDFAEKEFISLYDPIQQFDTVKRFRSNLSVFQKYAGEDLKFSSITPALIEGYMRERKKEGKTSATVKQCMATVRMVIKLAKKKGLMPKEIDVFEDIQIPKPGKTIKRALDIEHIKMLERVNLPKDRFGHEHEYRWVNVARDAWLFQFYNWGIRIKDIILMEWDHVQGGRLMYRTNKTDDPMLIDLSLKSLQILERYRGLSDKYIFATINENMDAAHPLLQVDGIRTLINKNLKVAARMAGIKKNLTAHMPNHSFADGMIKAGVPIEELMHLLGHESIKQTKVYTDGIEGTSMNKFAKEGLKKMGF